MHPDLDRLIRLQQLETSADEARRKIADHPQRTQALEERLAAARETVTGVKARLTEAQNMRRT
jgi:predicted  nucleic acid-binding Zn-ribbon protein